MKEPLSFFVCGKPQPAGSKRAFVLRKGGAFTGRAIITDANPNAKDWKTDVQREAVRHIEGHPWECPITLSLTFHLLRPKGHFGSGRNSAVLKPSAPPYPVSKPDSTKLCRGVEDALTGICWKDDAQVVTQIIRKRYNGRQGVLIEISETAP